MCPISLQYFQVFKFTKKYQDKKNCLRQLPQSVSHSLVIRHLWRPSCRVPLPGHYPTAKSTLLGQKETERHIVGRKVAAVQGPCSDNAGLADNPHAALPSGPSGQDGLGPSLL